MTELVYIGGYGRSGSTLLEALLATRRSVLACGEVVSCLRNRRDRGCTCGKSRQECDVWGPFHETLKKPGGTTHTALTLALLSRASGQFDLLVDSSKSAWGSLSAPFALRRALGTRFHLVHLVRNPRAVCWSNAAAVRKRGTIKSSSLSRRHLRTALGWWAANLSCELFGLLHPAQYRRVRYEDFVRSHAEVLEALFSELPHQHAGAGAGKGNRHQLYGNHNRYKSLAPAELREDVRWKTEMPVGHQALVSALSWPLRLRYGY